MDMDNDDEILRKLASGGSMDYSSWPILLSTIVTRIEKIANTEFPTPVIPLPKPISPVPEPRLLAPLPSSDPIEPPTTNNDSQTSSQETNKENTNPAPPPPAPEPAQEPGTLPPQVISLMNEITTTLTNSFPLCPPHTIQRLSELVLSPKQHYRSLPAYLHALDRVVHVTSGSNVYPLPPAVPDMSAMSLLANGVSGKESWANGASSASAGLNVGSDEALGGALLTPIPWLHRRGGSDGAADPGSESPTTLGAEEAAAQQTDQAGAQAQQQPGTGRRMEGQVRTESTETIDGPNGMGHIETVSVSVNGIPSHGAMALQLQLQGRGGVTQGELLREEQRAGVVPLSQLARANQARTAAIPGGPAGSEPASGAEAGAGGDDAAISSEEIPHARGPEEIGAADTGPQSASVTSSITGSGGVEMLGIDVEAAVGRKADHSLGPDHRDRQSPEKEGEPARSSTPKREAEEELEGAVRIKKLKEDDDRTEPGKGEGKEAEGAEEPKKDAEGDIVLPDETKPATDESGTTAANAESEGGVQGGKKDGAS